MKPYVLLSGRGARQLQIHVGTGLEVFHPLEILNRSLGPAPR